LAKILVFEPPVRRGRAVELETISAAETRAGTGRPAPAVAPEPEPEPERFGRYEVRGRLGEGSMCRVYRAYDPWAGREVAVKVLKTLLAADLQSVERFRREAAAGRRLDHPALVDVLDAGPGYLVQELVEGESLSALLDRRRPLSVAAALPILAAVADALDHVHGRGIVHRDVKPSNVLLPLGGGAKLADFGVARLGWAPITCSGEVIGTPAYMAPEQVSRALVHAQSDLYSLAVVAFETLTGVRPFRRPSLSTLLQSIVRDAPPRAGAINPALPPAVDALFARALAKIPEERYADGRAFVAALREALAGA
jgi:serine/threonine-protein kinase